MIPPNQDIFDAMQHFDSAALGKLLAQIPDGVLVHLINIAPRILRSQLFGAVKPERMNSKIRPQLNDDAAAPDPEKDDITRRALRKFADDLIAQGELKRDGEYYIG